MNLKLNEKFWEQKIAKRVFQRMQQPNFLLEPAAKNIKNKINESLVFQKKSFVLEKFYVYDVNSKKFKISGKGLK